MVEASEAQLSRVSPYTVHAAQHTVPAAGKCCSTASPSTAEFDPRMVMPFPGEAQAMKRPVGEYRMARVLDNPVGTSVSFSGGVPAARPATLNRTALLTLCATTTISANRHTQTGHPHGVRLSTRFTSPPLPSLQHHSSLTGAVRMPVTPVQLPSSVQAVSLRPGGGAGVGLVEGQIPAAHNNTAIHTPSTHCATHDLFPK